MVENNYHILGLPDDATDKEIREKFREQVLLHHSDRGGDDEKFKRLKTAYEDLKKGKKYPAVDKEISDVAKFYDLDEIEQKKHNLKLAQNIAYDVSVAQDWANNLLENNSTAKRLFGSTELGEIEMEVKANMTLFIRGKYWAGNFTYDGSIIMQGSITSPYFTSNNTIKTIITLKKGNFVMQNPIENHYVIESGSKITAQNGDIHVGNISGRKEILPDPNGRVGMTILNEHFTHLNAPNGKITSGNIRETSMLTAQEIITINLVDNVKIKGKKILIYGSKVNYDVEITLLQGGVIRFYDKGSGYDISDDAILKLENGKKFRLRTLKTSKFISYGGKDITFDYLDKL